MNMKKFFPIIFLSLFSLSLFGMEEENVSRTWITQLQKHFDTRYLTAWEAKQGAKRFFKEIINRSDTPVIVVWKPSQGDAYWKYAVATKKVGIPTKFDLLGSTGHAAIGWKDCNGEIKYASFWPDTGNRDSEKRTYGIWQKFHEDVSDEEKLPDVVYSDLGQDTLFQGKVIKGWNIEALDDMYEALQNLALTFDLKGRRGGYSCSTMTLDLIRKSIQTVDPTWALIEKCHYLAHRPMRNSAQSLLDISMIAAIGASLPVLTVVHSFDAVRKSAESSFRKERSVTPNYIVNSFKKDTWYDKRFDLQPWISPSEDQIKMLIAADKEA